MERRSFLKGFGAAAACAIAIPQVVSAADEKKNGGPNEMSYETAVSAITGGKALVASAKVKMEAPEIAENGAVVPVKITVDSPMSEKDYVKAIHVLASKNGNVRCANIYLTPANGEAYFGTRIKLGGTQDVVAIAEMSDGTFLSTKQNVKVTIGGCG
ncbi:MAG: thiosulfate oxidation carrier protein SoxY [Sulfuricurvum sp. PD_MW2]|jgi:sulfur-oxidizing protein SoxY|uniref:thiosulfate oxidation carrier protein SoxY n=1 Tax=Sulfuricurvum sp. PD_MW2 TaxID=2027917 RepID=UPI000C05CEC8|nr:thiosulfate oxidation carrier protein SoxY [Sulfuricurvum sp. PD_MW2]PHM18521.1 MAG: thiosulfate oxidation carrier protein SoxY [Sulfuricurvum sp. PD_MW2]